MQKRLAGILSPIFLLIPLVSSTPYFAGSTYTFPVEKCSSLNITVVCYFPIDKREFNFTGCSLVNLTKYQGFWSCNCYDNYKLKMWINPGAENICDVLITYLQKMEVPEQLEEYHYSSYIKEKPTIINITNITIEKVKEVPIFFENKTKVQELNFTIFNLNETINELLKEMVDIKKRYFHELQWYQTIICGLLILIVGYIIYQKVRRGRNVKNM